MRQSTNKPIIRRRGVPMLKRAGLFIAVLAMSFTARAQLSGNYTICSSGCNYSTINDAVSDLQTYGVNGATTFTISKGNYNEQVDIPSISGASSTNTITFKGGGTKPSETRIYYAASYTYVVQLDNTSNIILKNLTLENTDNSGVYSFSPALQTYYSSNCLVSGCRLIAPSNGYYYQVPVYQSYCDNITYENNYIKGGLYNIYMEGGGNSGNIVIGNKLIGAYNYGLYSYYQTGNTYKNNEVDSMTLSGKAGGYGIFSDYEWGINIIGNIVHNYNNSLYAGIYCEQPNGPSTSDPFNIINNLVSSDDYGIDIDDPSTNLHIIHNTVNVEGYTSYGAGLEIDNYSYSGFDIRNNILHNNGSDAFYFYQSSIYDIIDGNNYTSGTSQYIFYNGVDYTSMSSYLADANANGQGLHDQSNTVYFKSTRDLHLDPTKAAPFSPNAGVTTDIDGDARCVNFPTTGADEVSGGTKSAAITGTGFTGPSRVYYGNPATFLNKAKATDPKTYKWFINNVFVSDSIHLTTSAFKGPVDKVKLVAYNCGSKDSFTMSVTVDTPAAKPVADFIASANTILQGDKVKLTDLSSNYPSGWQWSISPDTTLDQFGQKVPVADVVSGGYNKPTLQLKFNYPGNYEVCLVTTNLRGTSNMECKSKYIEVIPSINLGSVSKTNYPQGWLYDNGGPKNNYGGYMQKDKILIDACADSVYLVFKYFDLQCGADVLRVFEGKDENGKELDKCHYQTYTGIQGYTGGPSSTWCSYNSPPGCIPKPTDTFKAKNTMYIEMRTSYGYSQPGFEAYYWTKPRSEKKPVAKFSAPDSICENGVINFINQSTGTNINYLWDLDGDISSFEAVTPNTSYPYFAAGPVKVTLVAFNCGGSDTFSKIITVFTPAKPVAQYSVDNKTPTIKDIVLFTSTTKECVDNYTWTFTPQSGTGTAQFVNGTSKSSANPQVTFPTKGCWDMKLVTTNNSGSSTISQTCVVNVRDPYCIPTVMNKLADLGISEVSFGDIDYKSPSADDAYHNYAPFATTKAEIGVTYKLTVTRPTNRNKVSHAVWIDWNQDGDFSDAKEYVDSEFSNAGLTWTTNVTVPTLAKVGATIMRIASNQGNWSSTPCGNNLYGEFEDYRLYVGPDATPPVITLTGKDTIRVEQGYTYSDAGATAMDNLDGNVTTKIVTTINKGNTSVTPPLNTLYSGTYVYHYNVMDAAGNSAREVRRVVIVTPDKTAPEVIVDQPDTVYVTLGGSYTTPAIISASDLVDGPGLDSDVVVVDKVNVNVVDTYTVVYTLTDRAGNTTKVFRTVIVKDESAPLITLIGSNPMYLEVYDTFTDPGVTITDNYYSSADLMKHLVATSNVDVTKVGTYTVVYEVKDPSGNVALPVTRTVIVGDTKAPVITLLGKSHVKMRVFEEITALQDAGATATDNYDKNVTIVKEGTIWSIVKNDVVSKIGDYTIVYKATDAAGNKASDTVYVTVVDDVAPVVTLKGPSGAQVCRWKPYVDAGYTVSDNYFDTTKVKVTKEGSILTAGTTSEGLFNMRYKAVDSVGNVGYSPWRIILVKSPQECGTTGIESGADLSKYISVYPNPTSGLFTVEASLPSGHNNVVIRVMNMLGQEVSATVNNVMFDNKYVVDLSGQTAGAYIVNITVDNETIVKQVILAK